MISFLQKIGDTVPSSVLAGMFISLGCVVNLKVGGIPGAVLFAFGLMSVVLHKLKLYTGTAGFIMKLEDLDDLGLILLGNILGCVIMSQIAFITNPDIVSGAAKIVESRISSGPWKVFYLATLCGFIMTTTVHMGRKGTLIPIIYGIPVFILCGFSHSIADAFYYLTVPSLIDSHTVWLYIISVFGNFVGCNLYRLIMLSLDY